MRNLNQSAFDEFEKALSVLEPQSPFGTCPYEWLQWILKTSDKPLLNESLPHMHRDLITRDQIYQLVKDPNVTTVTCVPAILAWGGMRRTSGMTALSTIESWLPICDDIRAGKLSRSDAYQKFMDKRLGKLMKGMGPAFFTKLIFFFMHGQEKQGYIMDQWTGASANLINGTKIVDLIRATKKGRLVSERVSDKNTKNDYENFCNFIESLAKKFNRNPVDIELAMFSEGRGNGEWRNYVVDSRTV